MLSLVPTFTGSASFRLKTFHSFSARCLKYCVWVDYFRHVAGGGIKAVQHTSQMPMNVLHYTSMNKLNQTLLRFWALEELPSWFSKLKPEDVACEGLFRESHSCDSHGCYEVRLAMKGDLPSAAAETRQMALGSLSAMHRCFTRDPKVAQEYREFIGQYEHLGHMMRVPASEIQQEAAWYLPHHAVMQALTFHRNSG